MKIIVIGDIHGNYNLLNIILQRTDAEFYLQVGDFGDAKNTTVGYPDLDKPLLFIPGNHECADSLNKFNKNNGKSLIRKNLWYLPIGNSTSFRGVTIAGFGGNYAENYYFKRRNSLEGRHRLHYTYEDYEKLLDYNNKLDILLTHEAPSPCILPKYYGDCGRKEITELLYLLNPMYHFYGHHHQYYTQKIGNTISRCLPEFGIIEIEM